MWEGKETGMPKTILKKKNKVGGMVLPDLEFTTTGLATVVESVAPGLGARLVEPCPRAPRFGVPPQRVHGWAERQVDVSLSSR